MCAQTLYHSVDVFELRLDYAAAFSSSPGSVVTRSLWQHVSAPGPASITLDGPATADAIVVGGGFTGLSCALGLAQSGHKVTLLEGRELGWGGTGRNAGQWLPGWPGRSPRSVIEQFGEERGSALNRFNRDASRLVVRLANEHGFHADVNQSGVLVVAHTPEKFTELEAIHRGWSDLDCRTKLISQRDIGRYLTTNRYFGGLLYEEGGTLNPLAYARGLANAALAAGVTIHTSSPAVRVLSHANHWHVETPHGSVVASRLAICTNAYTDGLWPGLDKVFFRVPMAMLASEPLLDRGAAFMPGMIPFGDTNRLALFGGMQDSAGRFIASVLPRLSDRASLGALSRGFDAKFRRVFAGIEPPRWRFNWMGHLCVVPDRVPRFFRLGHGAIAAMGYSGAGIAMGLALGREAARCLGNETSPDTPIPIVDPKPLRFNRIAPLVMRFVMTPLARTLDRRY